MQFTSKFILIALALACGGTAVSAAPVSTEIYIAARSDDGNDMGLFVRTSDSDTARNWKKVSPFSTLKKFTLSDSDEMFHYNARSFVPRRHPLSKALKTM